MNAATGGRQILIQGMLFVLVGLVWGLAIPHTPFPRLAVGAHVQFEQSGIVFMLVGIVLLTLPHRVGSKSIAVMLITVALVWLMAISEAANAWWGTIQTLPIAAHEAGATGGTPWQEAVIKLTHISAGLALIVSFVLLIIGFVKKPA
jgi:hydroxylaminobenzene mutase